MIKIKTGDDTNFSGMDAGIKLILTLFLAIIPFFCVKEASFALFFSFFALLSLVSGIPAKTLLKNVAAYVVIIILPLLFGVAVQGLFAFFGGGTLPVDAYQDLLYRLLRLFLVWYVTSLYIMTTPMEAFLGLLSKILRPLDLMKIPVSAFLSTIHFVMVLLTEMAGRFLQSYKELFSSYKNKSRRGFRPLVKDMAQVLISLISASLADVDKVQEMLENDEERGFSYRFRCSFPDVAAAALCCALLISVYFLERS